MVGDTLLKIINKQDVTASEAEELVAWANDNQNTAVLLNTIFKDGSTEITELSQITSNAGRSYAGGFVSATEGVNPEDADFTGNFQIGEGVTFAEGTITIGGAEAGVLKWGSDADGNFYLNSVTLNGLNIEAGITLNNFGVITQQTGTEGSEVRTMQMGMESNGTNGVGYINFYEPGSSVTIPNGDFASLDMTDWTQTAGTWTATSGYAINDTTSTNPVSITNAARFAVTAGSQYDFAVDTAELQPLVSTQTITIQVSFYTAITGGSLVSTETVGTRTKASGTLGWSAISKIITVPATATHAVFIASGTSSDIHKQFEFDNFTVSIVAANTRLSFKDGGLFYQPAAPLAEYQVAPAVVYGNNASGTISTSGQTTVFSITLPANFLAASGAFLRFSVFARTVTTTARTFTARLVVGATTTTVAASAALNSSVDWRFDGTVSRNTTDSQDVFIHRTSYSETASAGGVEMIYGNPTEDDAATIAVSFTLQLSNTVTAGFYSGVVVEQIKGNTGNVY